MGSWRARSSRVLRLARLLGVVTVATGCAGASMNSGDGEQGLDAHEAPRRAAGMTGAAGPATPTALASSTSDPATSHTETVAWPGAGAMPSKRCPPARIVMPELAGAPEDPPVPPIVDAERLAPFFERTALLFRGLASDHVRIAVYGDSNLTMDYQTGQMRRSLARGYGDAGHGFVALGRPWSHYQHMDVRHGVGGFVSYAASTDPAWDQVYGLSGISAESSYGGARAWVATADESSPIGRTASRLAVYYAKGPRWGRFVVRVDGARVAAVDSHAPSLSLGVERIEVADAPHELACIASDPQRPVRLLGATLERSSPGFVIDSFGVGALNSRAHAAEEPSINQAMLRERRYDLVIFATGANDVFTLDEAPSHMRKLVALHRAALPDTPILLLTPADRGLRDTFGPTLRAVEQRVAIAHDNGCALWDQFAAMGGRGSMKRLAERGLVRDDYVHFTQAGGAFMGDRWLFALLTAAKDYLQAHPSAGCEPDRRSETVARYPAAPR